MSRTQMVFVSCSMLHGLKEICINLFSGMVIELFLLGMAILQLQRVNTFESRIRPCNISSAIHVVGFRR
jgi:hypothetical protein